MSAPDFARLRRLTPARVRLDAAVRPLSLPALLAFQEDHAAARDAMQARLSHLELDGLAQRRDGHVVLARGLLRTLRARELAAAAQTLAAETGLEYRPLGENGQASGVYRRSVMLASGRFAMLDDGLGFTLVPWRPVVEQRLGQSVSATVQAGRVTWEFGRARGLGR